MRKLIFITPLFLLIFTFLGCVTTDPDLGKTLPYNYYALNCESFPANGSLKSPDIEVEFQISKMENNKYLITGTVTAVHTGSWGGIADQNLNFVFFLLKDKVIVDTVTAPLRGVVRRPMSLKKNFTTEKDFNGITVGRITGQAWEFI
jgi:hypothetical protein